MQESIHWDEVKKEHGATSILSKEAINHPDKDVQNFGKLSENSNCDNVFLEYRLALELKQLGLLDFIFPIFVGNP